MAFNALFIAAGVACVWFVTGRVTITGSNISKGSLWRSRSIRWSEIEEVRLHKRDGGAIELRAANKKLIVDSRFIAHSRLLDEVRVHTNVQPMSD